MPYPEATTPAARTAVISSLSETDLLDMIRDTLWVLDEIWLEALVTSRVLDASKEVSERPDTSRVWSPTMDQWRHRMIAFQECTNSARFVEATQDDMFGNLEVPQSFLEMRLSANVRGLFRDATEQVLRTANLIKVHPGLSSDEQSLTSALSVWANALVLVDAPVPLEQLLRLCPRAATTPVQGSPSNHYLEDDAPGGAAEPASWSPFFTAIQYGRLECLAAIEAAGVKGNIQIGARGSRDFRLTEFADFCHLDCKPETLHHVLARLVAQPDADHAGHDPTDGLLEKMNWSAAPQLENYQRAIAASGMFDQCLPSAMARACQVGLPGVVRTLGLSYDWVAESQQLRTSDSLLVRMRAFAHDVEFQPRIGQALLAYMDTALDHGVPEHILYGDLGHVHPDLAQQPLLGLVESGFNAAAVRFAEMGCDVRRRLGPQTPSILEVAEERSPETATLFRAVLARQAALAALTPGNEKAVAP